MKRLSIFYRNRRDIFMQMKHLIIFALAGIVILLGFNMMSGSQREKNREAITASTKSENINDDLAVADSNGANTDNVGNSHTADIAGQPLGQQPKAILDNATTKIEQAEQVSQQRVEQMADTQ